MNVVSLFDGISIARLALDNLGVEVDSYISCEVNTHAELISRNNHKDVIQLGSVTDLCGQDVLDTMGPIDLLIGGSPCQGFSRQGLQLGMADARSGLISHYFRILEELKPKYFLLENVRMNLEAKNYISSKLGVQPIEINSKLLVPQSRNRLYWTNLEVPTIQQAKYNVQDILLIPGMPGVTRKGPPRIVVPANIFGCLTASYYKGVRADGRPLVTSAFGEFDEVREHVRMLTPVECERLQGIPDNYTAGVANTHRYACLGNSFTLPVIEHILSGLVK